MDEDLMPPPSSKDEEMVEEEEEEDDDSDDQEEEEEDEEEEEEEACPAVAYVPNAAGGANQGQEGEGQELEELEMDSSAYVVYHQAHLGPPCLSFDLIPDADPSSGETAYPLSMYGVAGTQASKANANSIITFKMSNLHPIKQKARDDDDDEEDDAQDAEDPAKQPKLKIASIKHQGAINRLRFQALGSTMVASAWGENGTVGIYNLNNCLQKLDQPHGSSSGSGGQQEWHRENSAPLYSFAGHMTEGYAMNWSPTMPGVLATGDCNRNIHVWQPNSAGTWLVDQRPLLGHTASVEDVQWSPSEANVLASCSVDRSIRIWDTRNAPDKACMLTVAQSHASDVNVIDWNRHDPFIVSGGDDGFLKVWDLRMFDKGEPVATFKHHAGPVTSVEWHPTDSTVMASSGADDQIAQWDLAIEKDDESAQASAEEHPELKDLPPQLLFIHQGLKDIKEIHWHKKVPGLLVSTSHSGFDVFKSISI